MLVSSLPKNEQELIEYCRHCNTRGQACGIRFMLRRGFNRKQIAREMNMTIEQVIEYFDVDSYVDWETLQKFNIPL